MRMIKKIATALLVVLALGACDSEADTVSENLSKAADNFEIMRRVVFYNGITGEYMLTIEGLCSLGNHDDAGELTVTCKTEEGTGRDSFKKHFLGLSDNVTYFVEQVEGADVSAYHYRVVFKPQTILPDIDMRTDVDDLPEEQP
jgi:hypothetical protein